MSKALDMARELVKKLEEEEKQPKVQLLTLNPGNVFKIGEHDFIVLMQCREETAVISKGFMAENVKFDEDSRNYKESNLKKVIENLIQPVIEKEVGSKNLIEHEVDLTSVDMQDEFGGFKCKVRPITFEEARLYNNLLVNKNLNDWWWTCTPWSTEDRGWKYSITVVAPSGYVVDDYCDGGFGVRPFCILKSNIFVSKGE
jgi:hypothetical protein|nr:MAG TPA: hypothetical protein [Bacteriophage sp.]